MKTLIIGGVAGGATAATRLRRKAESAEIIIIERGQHISYANCGLPYYAGNVIEDKNNILLMTPERMKERFNIDVRVLQEAVKINPEDKTVLIRKLDDGTEYLESYDNLILATGSSPLKPPVPGIDEEGIFKLWNVPDADTVREYIENRQPKKAAVIGGGFIGLEMAENLKHRGLDVSIVEMQNQVMAPLDLEMANLIHENICMNDVDLILGDGVKKFYRAGGVLHIELNSGRIIDTDMVMLNIGVRPNSELAKTAGIKTNARGGIIVNDRMETSAPGVYAVGDVIEVNNFITGNKTMIPLAGPANKQARMLADILTGDDEKYPGTMGTSIAQVFDLNAASTGINEKQLIAEGKRRHRDYHVALIQQKSHAGYYPDATLLTLKMIFEPSGKILGAQIVGQDGVDKRIDTIATTIALGGTVQNLAKLELAYAPPFSSAKDPVNMLGFVAQNILDGLVKFTSYEELIDLTASDGHVILDVSEAVERSVSSIPGSYHIPLGQLRERMNELGKDAHIIVYCAIGVRSYNGARILMQNGFTNVTVLEGGMTFYKSMNYSCRTSGESNNDDNGSIQFTGNDAAGSDAAGNDAAAEPKSIKVLNCCGMQCPGPIMKVNETLAGMEDGETLEVSATDMGFARDVESWCKQTGNTFVKKERQGKQNIVQLVKGSCSLPASVAADGSSVPVQPVPMQPVKDGKTMIVFSGDLDKVLASFIIANGAAAAGKPVTMFFTFWGLNALRKKESMHVKKPFMDAMFGKMMPRGTDKLKLSNMNMGGMGTAMLKKVMNDKNVESLESLMKSAMANGVKLVACTMSMDIMGITPDELIDGVELAGVASYLGDAENSNVNLFI